MPNERATATKNISRDTRSAIRLRQTPSGEIKVPTQHSSSRSVIFLRHHSAKLFGFARNILASFFEISFWKKERYGVNISPAIRGANTLSASKARSVLYK